MSRSAMHHFEPPVGWARASGGWQGAFVLMFAIAFAGPARAAEKIEYNRDVRPILSEYCFGCHGPDSAARKADLRLDRREAAIEMGAITPGDTKESELIARLDSKNPKEVMPP